MNANRQRLTMTGLLCQYCAHPAGRTQDGYLFLDLPPTEQERETGWPEKSLTAHPPLCVPHARESIERCCRFRTDGVVALRSWVPRLYGVAGAFYRRRADGLEVAAEETVTVSYKDKTRLPWLLASQLVRQLTGVTHVPIKELLKAA
ncbi:hypothetical protein Sfr7A_25635 [Streptomyces xinghaiensis]|uniref:Uncharacterized protein n=1 Tax=Streptomyces xinghaiensis TaxID=1038928 RepID=A0A3M8EWV3_9ACTN|nr:hypothetical protein BEN35_22775 [Streptomyces fradiae]PQM20580.1 hypothetical protein Sfr7A_25635 [Streptomyces xinghaiensis]RKM92522.1 hypothetical protein SFRA_024290 [Streptomyces xinghaiensis]RNC70489.1 hypothetical protein DC095_025280 [Streptomyces xinghaiensis]